MDVLHYQNLIGSKDSEKTKMILETEKLKVKDVARWNSAVEKNQHGQSGEAVRFAERFGILCQYLSRENGKPIKLIADEAMKLADDRDIKHLFAYDPKSDCSSPYGLFFMEAIDLLSETWHYGIAIRAWNESRAETKRWEKEWLPPRKDGWFNKLTRTLAPGRVLGR